MKTSERIRIGVKGLEFSLAPRWTRLLAGVAGLSDPFRPAEHRLKCLFVHVPKAAGTSISRALFDDKSRHIAIGRYFAFDPFAAADYFKFAFVRNPWDRFHSAYHYLARRIGADPSFPDHRWATHFLGPSDGFEGFIERMASDRRFRREVRQYIHFRDQADWLTVPGRGMAMDFVGRFETLEEDFADVCVRVGVENPLPHERRGRSDDYRQYFEPWMVDFIGSIYQRDVGLFGYEFDGCAPSRRVAVGQE